MGKCKIFIGGAVLLLMCTLWAGSLCAVDESGGIGLKLAQLYDQRTMDHRGSLVVLDVFAGSPAEDAGIKRGDIITHIDGELTKGRDFMEMILNELRDEIGSEVKLKIWRFQTKKRSEIKLTRVPMVY